MNRSKKFYKRAAPQPDCVYGSATVSRLINRIMLHGKKNKTANYVYAALAAVEKKFEKKADSVLEECLLKVHPKCYLRPKKIASKLYKIPTDITYEKARTMALKWFKDAVQLRKESSLDQKIFGEICDIMAGAGKTKALQDEYHRIAKDNEAFAHYG